MKGILNGGRHGMRAFRTLAVRCNAQLPSSGSSAAGKMPRIGGSEGPKRAINIWNSASSSKRPSSNFRMFSSGGGGSGGGGSGGGGGGGGGGGSGGLWAAYLALLDRKPVFTKSITAAILNGLGDIIAQYMFKDGDKFNVDLKRLSIFAFLGLAWIGPALHLWYGSLSKISLTGTAGAIARMGMDQLLFAPFFVGSIVAAIMALEGHAAQVPDKLKSDLFTIIKSNWAVWVPFQFINFRFVPVHLQVLASNVVALGWNTYMSWASHNKAA